MERYDYEWAMTQDVKDYIENEIDFTDFEDLDELEGYLNEILWVNDYVTGNASGSYTCNTWKAEEYISHNLELLAEALQEFSYTDVNILEKGAEWCDVTIRCYLLGQIIGEVMRQIEDDFEAAHPENEED